MGATIIDALVVTLGLDSSPYKRAAREAAREQSKLKDSVKKGSNEVSDAIREVASEAGKLFLGFEGIKGAINFFSGLNVTAANLGRFSRNLGESAHEVNTWGSAVELAGGSAQDANADLQNLSASITALRTTREVSPLLMLFSRMGVALTDAQGKTRKLTDLYKELGDKLKQYNRVDAYNLARQHGLSESTFNLIMAEGKERDRLLATAERNNSITEETTRKAEALQEQWREVGQEIKGSAFSLLTDVSPNIKAVIKAVGDLFNTISGGKGAQSGFSIFIKGMIDALGELVKLLNMAVSGWKMLFDLLPKNDKTGKNLTPGSAGQSHGAAARDAFDKAFGLGKYALGYESPEARKEHDELNKLERSGTINRRMSKAERNNPGDLRFAGQPGATNVGGFAAFRTLAEGIQASNRQLNIFAGRGINTIDKIISKWAPPNENNTAAYKAYVSKFVGKGLTEELTASDRQKLLQAIFNDEGVNKVSSGQIASVISNPNALSAARFANNQALLSAPAGGGNTATTTIDIGEVTVHAPNAKNADEIAAELPGALRRKGVVAQADSGMS